MKKILFIFLLFLCSTFQVSAAIYMKFPGVDGEVTAANHEKEIELSSINFGFSRAISAGAGAAREAATPTFSEITITKMMDVSSTPLMKAAVGNPAAGDVIITLNSISKDTLFTFCKITLSNVLISSYSLSSGGDRPSESLSLNFTKVKVEYFTEGAPSNPPFFGWDLATAKPL